MPFDPKTNKYPYPTYTAEHYLVVKKDRGIIFDDKYPYIDNSKGFKFKRFFVRFLLNLIVFPFSRIKMGLKIEGKDILKKNKELIKSGVISISNHIHMWDYISIMKAIRPIKPYTIVWDKNINGESGNLARLVGGIPIPNNLSGQKAFYRSLYKLLDEKNWLHIYPEGSMWEYYYPIRPFKMGFADIAIKANKPIIPLAFSYRKPGFIRKLFKVPASLTLKIGNPIFINNELEKDKRKIDLINRCHDEICILANIDPKDNIYESIYNNSKKINYY